MANNTVTLNKILAIFRDLSIRHEMINDFGFGETADIGASRPMLFPYLWVEPTTSRITQGSTANKYQELYYSFNIYIMDKIQKGDDNFEDTLSDTNYILATIVREMSQHPYYVDMSISLSGDISFEPAIEASDDNVNGWQAQFTLKIPLRYGYCETPIAAISGWTSSLTPQITEYRLIGPQGYQGVTGPLGPTGPAGGPQGFQGPSGADGTIGIDGNTGPQGFQGFQGPTGIDGPQGQNGQSSTYFNYDARTSITSGNPGNTHVIWNNATQVNATQLNISHINADNIDIDIFLALLNDGDVIILQDAGNSANYQKWQVNGTITIISNSYVEVPVLLIASGGTGTTNFANNLKLILAIISAGIIGPQGPQGFQGDLGPQGVQGPNDLGLQTVLINDSVLTQNNSINSSGNDLQLRGHNLFEIVQTTDIAITVDNSSVNRVDDGAGNVTDLVMSSSQANLKSYDGTKWTEIVTTSGNLYIVTPGVVANSVSNNWVLTLIDSINGQVEYTNISGAQGPAGTNGAQGPAGSNGVAGPTGPTGSNAISYNRQTGTTYSLVLSDLDKMVEMNNAAANTLTVPLNSSQAFSIGSTVLVSQYGAGQTTIAPAGGVTLRSVGGWLKMSARYGIVALYKVGTDEWYVAGSLTP